MSKKEESKLTWDWDIIGRKFLRGMAASGAACFLGVSIYGGILASQDASPAEFNDKVERKISDLASFQAMGFNSRAGSADFQKNLEAFDAARAKGDNSVVFRQETSFTETLDIKAVESAAKQDVMKQIELEKNFIGVLSGITALFSVMAVAASAGHHRELRKLQEEKTKQGISHPTL